MSSRAERNPTIGKYDVVEQIGKGGYATVYKGYDPLIKRFVAIKTCRTDDDEIRGRFFREAEITGKLDHPNIVRIYDLGLEDDVPYLVQEYLDGEDLDRKIERRDYLPDAEKVLYLIQIARGLEFAHSHGVIHRDIKPANIRVLEDGTAKIMDFGIARLQHIDTALTQAGLTVGTAAYLAPEQVRGEEATAQTDIFSYGVLAYELITGERPFGRETISATFFAILNRDPRPLPAFWPDCPRQAVTLVHRCLQKDPKKRYRDCDELLNQLESIRDELKARRFDTAPAGVTRPIRRGDMLTVPLEALSPEASLDEVRLAAPGRATRSGSQPTRRRSSRAAALLLVLVALAAIAAWRFPEQVSEALTEILAAADARADTPGPEAAHPPPAGPAEATPPAVPGSAPVAAEPAAIATAPSPEPPPPAPAPVPATLVLAAGWSPELRVAIDGGPPISLDRARVRPVEPGDHSLTFSLLTRRFRAMETVAVSLAPGERRVLTAPFPPPGMLTVQAALGSRQGLVQLDGEPPVASPLRRTVLAPGSYRVTILEADGKPGSGVPATLEVRSGAETVVTFDLSGRRDIAVRSRPIASER